MKFPRPRLPTPGGMVLGFALACVAVTSAFVMYMVVWLTNLMSDPSWCDRAIGAARDATQQSAFGGCFALLTQQMSALAINSYIFGGVIALCLLTLMVIVVAGGKISFTGSRDGVSGSIGRGDIPPAAQVTTTTTTAVAPGATPVVPPVEPTLEDTP